MQSIEDWKQAQPSQQAEQSGNNQQWLRKNCGNSNPPPPPPPPPLSPSPQLSPSSSPQPPQWRPYFPELFYSGNGPPHLCVHHQPQQQQQNGESRTVWVGDLHHWMDENYLHSCFASTGEIASIKVIRNKHTGLPEGYGFVEFFSHGTAEKVLQIYSGIRMPNTEQPFHLNWATNCTGDKRSENAPDLLIFVGDLAADVTDSLLHETFANKYPSVKAANVVFNVNTGHSKGYGFVRFGDESERLLAMSEMNGVYCSSRPMRISPATRRKSSGYQSQYFSQGGCSSIGASSQSFQSDGDSANTTQWKERLQAHTTPCITSSTNRSLRSQILKATRIKRDDGDEDNNMPEILDMGSNELVTEVQEDEEVIPLKEDCEIEDDDEKAEEKEFTDMRSEEPVIEVREGNKVIMLKEDDEDEDDDDGQDDVNEEGEGNGNDDYKEESDDEETEEEVRNGNSLKLS